MGWKDLWQKPIEKSEWERSYSNDSLTRIDYQLLYCIIALMCIGFVMVFSASISLSDSPKYATQPQSFLVKQVAFSFVGILIARFVVFNIPMRSWKQFSLPIGIIAVVLLLLVAFTPLGKEVNGSVRWLSLGPINIQVSEIAKFATVIVAARFTVTRQLFMHSFIRGLMPILGYMLCMAYLIMSQPDLGATVVVCCIAIGVAFLGGLAIRIVVSLIGAGILGIFVAIVFAPWRVARVMAYLDPWSPDHVFDKAYQLTHSLIAFGRGELFGVGLGASVEKMHYLPEAHTDFILAVIGEELGLLGVTMVLLLFYFLIRRSFEIGRQALRLGLFFSGFVAQGVGVWFGVQTVINVAVVSGLVPTKGLTLPLISYGGSSMVIMLCMLAVLFRVDYENRRMMYGKGS